MVLTLTMTKLVCYIKGLKIRLLYTIIL